MLAGGWEATQQHGSAYAINGKLYQLPTLYALAKAGLAEQFVLVPGAWPTHAFRITEAGRKKAGSLT